MLAAASYYPCSCNPKDVWESKKSDRGNYFFIDVQSRGEYPNYGLKMLAEKGITLERTAEDAALLKAHTVDFIPFLTMPLGSLLQKIPVLRKRKATCSRPLKSVFRSVGMGLAD